MTGCDHPGAVVRPPRLLFALLTLGTGVDLALGQLGMAPITLLMRLVPGFGLVAIGGVLLAACMRRFQKAGTNVPTIFPTTAIVTGGAYRFSRNPIYVALLLIYAGLCLAIGTPSGLALGIVGALTLHFGVVKREERYLLQKFGDEYAAYQRRVRRWL